MTTERKDYMKHFLLTWYGITDLRAALGFEAGGGPILGALRTGNFTNVIILAYTNPDKDQDAFADGLRTKWETWKAADIGSRQDFPRDLMQQAVDAASNTAAGHALFTNWLKAELRASGIDCNIRIIPQELKKLNDTQGIHKAAASALKQALDDASEKTITVFVSPGTPVMAYTWALIARVNPQHNIGVIASSDPRQPPETICLPKDLPMPVVAASHKAKPSGFDVIIHLLGRERMPIYFGMLQFQAKEHVFVTTQEFAEAAKTLSRLLPSCCRTRTVFINDPFKPADTRKAVETVAQQLPPATKISVNLTGGTKLMFAGALSVCWERGLEPFYFEINQHNVIFLRDGATVPFVGATSVTDFFAVNGFDIVTPGHWADQPCRESRLEVTRKLWEMRSMLGELYKNDEFRKYKVPWAAKRNPPFQWKWKKSQATFDNQGNVTLVLDGKPLSVSSCDDFGQYIGGGWLEEHVHSLLRPLEKEGMIHDLRIGVEVDYAGKSRRPKDAPNGEFDGAFTDGKRLWLVECKAGAVKQEHIQKLENNLKTYGGIAAKGILVSAFPIGPALLKRISSSTSIHAVHSEDLGTETLRKIISL